MADIKAEYIDHMGSDLTVVNAARVSFDFAHMFNQRTDVMHRSKFRSFLNMFPRLSNHCSQFLGQL